MLRKSVLARTPGLLRALVVVGLVFPGGGVLAEGSVAEEFRSLCDAYRGSYQVFYGERRRDELVALLEEAAPDGATFLPLSRQLAWEQLKLGEAEAAVHTLQRALAAREPSTLPRALRNALEGLLVLAHLQAAEDENCIVNHNRDSCLLPLRDGGVHLIPRHARAAGNLTLQMLEREGFVAQLAWIANLARMASGDWPQGVPEQFRLPAATFEDAPEVARWFDIAPGLGVDSTDLAGGAIMDDFDGDGLLDLVSSTCDPCASMKAFRNDGRGGFEDVTEAWGLHEQLGGLNVVHADYDNDGRLDLLVLRGGWMHDDGRVRNSLLRNRRDGEGMRFEDVTQAAGLAAPALPTQTAAWADFDGDGDLDVYIGNEGSGKQPYPSQLFRNEGEGRFVDVAAALGVRNERYTKGVTWGDFDNDGDPDLYVSTNNSANRLYRNDGGKGFTDVATALGVRLPASRSFATWFFDYDNDGRLDLFVGNFENPPAQAMAWYFDPSRPATGSFIYRNEGVRFANASPALGLRHPTLPMGANHGDLNNDGWPDIYLGTGEPAFETQLPNVMYLNRAGKTFEEVTYTGGFGHLQKGHGVAFGDIDNDGDQDLFHQLGGFFPGDRFGNALFENPAVDTRWITLRLRGVEANRFALGARIRVVVRGDGREGRTIHALAGSGGSFGGSSLQQEIGLGDARSIERVEVEWPGSGTRQTFTGLRPNRTYELIEGERKARLVHTPTFTLRPASEAHRHHGDEGA